MQKELHCFILWEKARIFENEIIQDIRRHFTILKIYEITWKKHYFSHNLSRFYGKKLLKAAKKKRDCGIGSFLFILVLDSHPQIEDGKNTNLMFAKAKYRSMLHKYGSYLVHASDTAQEADNNMLMILGINAAEFLQNNAEVLDNTHYIPYIGGMLAERGWKSAKQLFDFCAKQADIRVISNKQPLELRAKNPEFTARLINAHKKLFHKNLYSIKINHKNIDIRIRRLKDVD